MNYLLLFTALCTAAPAGAETPLHDPGIAHNEVITYTVTREDRVMTMVETTAVVSGAAAYRITSHVDTDDKVITVRRRDMTGTAYRHTWRNNGTRIRRTHALDREGPVFTGGAIALIHYHVVPYVLRGFPFGKGARLDVLMQGGDDPMRLYVKYDGTATVETGAGPVACHKLEMGMPGFLGSVVPKTYYWYSVDAPHYLVQYEGASGPPGSPKKTVLLQSYVPGNGQ